MINQDLSKYLGKYTQLKSNLAEQIIDAQEISEMVNLLKIYSEYYTKKYKMTNLTEKAEVHIPTYGSDFFIEIHCICTTIIILYYKCFDKSSKTRKFTIGRDIFKDDSDLLKRHDYLIDTRNKLIAHDDDMLEIRGKMLAGIDEEGVLEFKIAQEVKRILTLQDIEIDFLFPLLEKMTKYLDTKIKKIGYILRSSEYELVFKNPHSFLLKLENKDLITQKDIDKWKKTQIIRG